MYMSITWSRTASGLFWIKLNLYFLCCVSQLFSGSETPFIRFKCYLYLSFVCVMFDFHLFTWFKWREGGVLSQKH